MRSLLPIAALLAACNQDVFVTDDGKDDAPEPIDSDVGRPLDQPDIELAPTRLEFGALPPGCPATQTFTITNVGTATLEVDAFELVGPDAAYDLDAVGPFTLEADEQVEVGVTFEAPALTTYNVRVSVPSNDPDEPTARVSLVGEGAQAAFREELFTQEQADKVDILWVVDTSSSMTDNLAQVASAMDRFIDVFVTLGLDYRMGVVTTDMDSQAHSGRMVGAWMDGTQSSQAAVVAEFERQIAQGDTGSTTEKGFQAAQAALSAPLANQGFNAGFLRTDATLAVVVVSDEDDRWATVEAGTTVYPARTDSFVTWLQGLKADPNDASFSALTCKNAVGFCSQYHRAIGKTRGVSGDIDKQPIDINPFLSHLSFVAAGLDVAYALASTPTNTTPSAITVTVDGRPVPFDPTRTNGWTYDAATNSIVFWGDAIPDPGESVVVRYPYDAGC